MKELTYLHISDIHFGNKWGKPLWSNIKQAFFQDIDYVCGDLLNGVDVIIVTGDLAQTGDAKDYEDFDNFLSECLTKLNKKSGKTPVVFIVPGNHDLYRYTKNGNPEFEMLKQWTSQDNLKMTYFWSENSSYLKFVNETFANYSNYVQRLNSRQNINRIEGRIIGDFYSAVEVNGIKLGVVGLNSSFLQQTAGDYKKKVGVYLAQLCGTLGDDYNDILSKNDFNILLTHHAPDWYEDSSYEQYSTEIYSQGKFVEHYCGHNHAAKTVSVSENNAVYNRVTIGHSLCGIDFEDKTMERIHGYEAGRYIMDEVGDIKKEVYPRIAMRKVGGFGFDKDTNYTYAKGRESFVVDLCDSGMKLANREVEAIGGDVLANKIVVNKIPSEILKESKAHKYVRNYEREVAINGFTSKRFVWITTHYGLCSERFLSSVLEQNKDKYNFFTINAEECDDIDVLENQIKGQYGEPFNTLVDDLCKSYNHPMLIFRDLSNAFIKQYANHFVNLISSALSFNGNLTVAVISNTEYSCEKIATINLTPFTLDEVKIYVENSTANSTWGVIDYEKIHRLSSGYPLCVDLILQQLQYVEIDDLNSSDYLIEGGGITIPTSLQTYIKGLRSSSYKEEKRRYLMLYLLSLLPKGESFAVIKRYDHCLPFYPTDVTACVEKDLLSVEYYYNIAKDKKSIEQIKVLRVPTIYREYILSLEDDSSKESHHRNICELYLGSRWYAGEISNHMATKQQQFTFANSNISSSLSYLIQHSINDVSNLNRYLRTSYNFISELYNKGLFYTGCVVANEIYNLIKDVELDAKEFNENRAYIKFELARLLRMMRYANARTYFEELLEESKLPLNNLQICRESLAYLSSGEEAKKYAMQLQQNAPNTKSISYYIGKYIVENELEDKEERKKKLTNLRKAVKRLFESSSLMANITISLSYLEDEKTALKQINQQVGKIKDSYSSMRLLSRKYELVMQQVDPILKMEDVGTLRCVYTYAFTQMLPALLNAPHRILWNYYISKKDYEQVAMLFKYSSFVWTLKGCVEEINEYKEKIRECSDLQSWIQNHERELEL